LPNGFEGWQRAAIYRTNRDGTFLPTDEGGGIDEPPSYGNDRDRAGDYDKDGRLDILK